MLPLLVIGIALSGLIHTADSGVLVHPEATKDVIYNSSVALNVRKMSQLLKRQDILMTCRYLLFKHKDTWEHSKDHCDNINMPMTNGGARLASVHTSHENREIRTLLQLAFGIKQVGRYWNRDNWVWVGLQKIKDNSRRLKKNERGRSNFYKQKNNWIWPDGKVPEFSNWLKKMPDQQKKKKKYQNNLMINKKGQWDDTFSYIKGPHACNYCGRYIVVEAQVTWPNAKELCKSYGLTMAIIRNQFDNEELAWAANITLGPDPWPKRWNSSNWIWIGAEEIMGEDGNGTEVWQHHDGTPMEWNADWEPNTTKEQWEHWNEKQKWDRKQQPDNWVLERGEQDKIAVSRINMKWDDSYAWHKRPFACMCPQRSCNL